MDDRLSTSPIRLHWGCGSGCGSRGGGWIGAVNRGVGVGRLDLVVDLGVGVGGLALEVWIWVWGGLPCSCESGSGRYWDSGDQLWNCGCKRDWMSVRACSVAAAGSVTRSGTLVRLGDRDHRRRPPGPTVPHRYCCTRCISRSSVWLAGAPARPPAGGLLAGFLAPGGPGRAAGPPNSAPHGFWISPCHSTCPSSARGGGG